MFRTSNIRGLRRFGALRALNVTKPSKLTLTKFQVTLIEEVDFLTLSEKIELFLVSLGNKLTTEIYMTVPYTWSNERREEVPSEESLARLGSFLEKLPFIFFQDAVLRKNRRLTWYQVSVNEAVSKFMEKFPDDLTEFEEGVLYGYPLSAIRAYSGLIEAKHDKLTPAAHYLAGVCSVDFWDDEQEYYQLWWERLRLLSPRTVTAAEKKFAQK